MVCGSRSYRLLLVALVLVFLFSACTYALTPWKFRWGGDAGCGKAGNGAESRYRGTRLTLKIAPLDRSPVQSFAILIDADGRATYLTGGGATGCLQFSASDLEAVDRLWTNDGLLERAPQACGPGVSLLDGGPLPERWNFKNCGSHYRSDSAETCLSAGVAMAGRAASAMRNVWIEYVGVEEDHHLDFRWDLAVPLPHLYEETLVETFNLVRARSDELRMAMQEHLPPGFGRRIDCRSDDPARLGVAGRN